MRPDRFLLFVLFTAAIISVKTGKLTLTAAIGGLFLGLLIFLGAGYTGVAMVGIFFLLGTMATSWKSEIKAGFGVEEKNKGKRNVFQVFANAGVAGILGFLAYLYPERSVLFQLMMAASLASATSDTLSSELGNLYGKNFYNVSNLKKDKRGLDGVVSLEGTLFGILGGAVIAIIYGISYGWNVLVLIIVIAGTLGNLSDSLIGATLERRAYLKNDGVNFLNTAIAALLILPLKHLI
jgi:uncharacterized protein (TIGR00297 family)